MKQEIVSKVYEVEKQSQNPHAIKNQQTRIDVLEAQLNELRRQVEISRQATCLDSQA